MILCVSGVVLPLCGRLRDGHVAQRQSRHIHVQHAVRLQVPDSLPDTQYLNII